MKRILALILVSVMTIASTVTVFAANSSGQTGSKSPAQEKIEELEKELKEKEDEIKAKDNQIAYLAGQLQAKSSGGGSSSSSPSTPPSSNGNSVNYGGTVTYQGGKIEINGGKSNVTFTIKTPSSTVLQSARSLANQLSGTLLSCINTSSPGASFKTAKVNFFVTGVTANDNIAVYQNQGGTWVQLPVEETRQDHVVVNITKHGDIAFVRVPVMAAITQ